MSFRQARWNEPLVFEMGFEGRVGTLLPEVDEEVKGAVGEPSKLVPERMLRREPPDIPELSEVEVLRHFVHLSQMNYGVNSGRMYPLGSCTMKYNPVVNELLVRDERLAWAHPYQDPDTVQGILEILYTLKTWLAEITGMDDVSLQPSAGAHGEFLGVLIIRAYHRLRGELEVRREIIVPDSAHGTNPASAVMGGFKVVTVPSDGRGCVDMEALETALSERTAGLMLTNPNTLGLFEDRILEIADMVHGVGALLYYDGANLNAILGKCRPGDMGFDIVHLNIHKTFSTPHGGGGPGAGPIAVKRELSKFLPAPTVEFDGEKYYLDYDRPHAVGRVRGFLGNVVPLVKAFAYILSMGPEGLREAAEVAVLNSNYLMNKLRRVRGFSLPYGEGRWRKHEFVLSSERLRKETGVGAGDVAKALIDHGFHPPTMYFPPIVEEALMVEPTETEPLEELDRFADALAEVSRRAYENPEAVRGCPRNASASRVDEVRASHPKTMCLSWRMYKSRLELRKCKRDPR